MITEECSFACKVAEGKRIIYKTCRKSEPLVKIEKQMWKL